MSFGVLSYVGTNNLGDEIQSLAALARIPTPTYYLNRDKLNIEGDKIEGSASVIMNGWYCQRPENWPPSKKIRPLFVSMHITQERVASGLGVRPSEFLLTSPLSNYLRDHGPIGARDLTTKNLLQNAGIDSYFSGCMTLTLERPVVTKNEDLIVLNDLPNDVIACVRSRTRKHILRTYHTDFAEPDSIERFNRAQELLEVYARASCVVTTRLHCALPCLAMGTPVLLIDVAADQYRFLGLKDLVHHCSAPEFVSGRSDYNVDHPPANQSQHIPYREDLIRRVAEFVRTADSTVWPRADYQHPTQREWNETVRSLYRRDNKPQPTWRAKQATFLKKRVAPSTELAPSDRINVEPGAVLGGTSSKKIDGHILVDKSSLNGSDVQSDPWYIYEEHWKSIDQD